MINSQAFFTGLKSLKGARSPALPLAACFVALGALFKDAGFNIQQSAASSLFTYACLLYTSPSPRDQRGSRMPSSA